MPRTPISYYGGKQNLVSVILPLIPPHRIYTEAFFGGGAIFFAKEPSEAEVINDTNVMAIVFYRMVKRSFDELKQLVEETLFCRETYNTALRIYKTPHLFSKLQQAWAFHIATNMGFSCKIGSWGYDKYGKRVKAFRNKKIRFDHTITERLENAQIECNDACTVISSRDTVDTFHYVDPPYIHSNQGHYDGYTEHHYQQLLETLSKIKGTFLLSSYESELLEQYTQQHGWYTIRIEKPLTANLGKAGEPRKKKVEVLTANYPI